MIKRVLLGFMGIHILHHASKGEVTGSFMMEELKRHGYSVSPGTIYPLLPQDGGVGPAGEPVGSQKRKARPTLQDDTRGGGASQTGKGKSP